ncbi:MAG TPA: hypothetical protein VKY89_17150, partial [Thermoanaerobaculia bacterium]|nr:hypothetical protein [Thermoanaerobaculia bacterium]
VSPAIRPVGFTSLRRPHGRRPLRKSPDPPPSPSPSRRTRGSWGNGYYLGAKTDAYRANELRAILVPLASRHGCAALAVRHLNKSRDTCRIYAAQGSIHFTAAARSVLLAG